MTDKKHVQTLTGLLKERKRILALPPEKALDAILESPQAMPLIHSFPEQDFYFLIHDIGVEDSLQLLSLASTRQWEYIIDTESWVKDRINYHTVTRWFDLLMQADPGRLIQWLRDDETEFLELYLFKHIEVKTRIHDQDPSDFEDDFFTLDDIFYIRFIEYPSNQKSETEDRELLHSVLSDLIRLLAESDHVRYQHILLEAAGIIPAESEEEIFRRRNIRMAEKGVLPFDDAVGVYQPIKPAQMKPLRQKLITRDIDGNMIMPVPQYTAGMLREDNLFTQSLQLIKPPDILHEIQAEFAALCNRIIAADQKIIKEKGELKAIVKKACGYLAIGLQRLSNTENPSPDQTASLIHRFPLSEIFRTGFGLVLDLRWKAEKWKKTSWFFKNNLPLNFWAELWMGVLGGLLLKKPLYYDNYRTGVLFREFESMRDILETETILKEIIEIDGILSQLDIPLTEKDDRSYNWKNIVLTLWTRHHMGLAEELIPLTVDEFRRFYNDLFLKPEKEGMSTINPEIKSSFLNWLAARTGNSDIDISNRLGQIFEHLFDEIENEYKDVIVSDLDPRHIYFFLVH